MCGMWEALVSMSTVSPKYSEVVRENGFSIDDDVVVDNDDDSDNV